MKLPYVTSACQRMDIIGAHTMTERMRGQLNQGLGIKSGLMRLVRGGRPTLARGVLGAPSQFADGSWVRVRPETEIRAMLDSRLRTRGLEWGPQQWASCGRVYRVLWSVRRLIDDGGVLRKVDRSVLIAEVDCGGEDGTKGCGRFCPFIYRDEWLEAIDAPVENAVAATTAPTLESTLAPTPAPRYARVKSLTAIQSTLDPFGRRQGLTFMPEMARHAGTRVLVQRRLGKVFEHARWLEPPAPVYILEGLRCTGDVLGPDGPCGRGCWQLWHGDWLELEP